MTIQLDEALYLEMLSMPRGTQELQEDFISEYLSRWDFVRDGYGNVYIAIEQEEEGAINDVAFMSHIDTVHRSDLVEVDVCAKGGFAFVPEGADANCLGADCTTGIWIMLNMIENKVPGLYCFFLDEEVGCLGSQWAADNLSWDNINHAISFDRYGTTSIITHQMGVNTASKEFAEELSERFYYEGLPYQPDDGGVYTDSNSFVNVINNCTNISVGYYSQHTRAERQDLNFLIELIDVCCSIDWSGLPIGTLIDDSYDYDEYYTQYSFGALYELEELMWDNPRLEEDVRELIEKYKSDDDKLNDPFYAG